jgi:ribosomal protein S8
MNSKIISFLNSLKNSSILQKNDFIKIEYTKKILVCVEILYKEGFILSYFIKTSENEDRSYIYLKLRLVDGIVSTSGIRHVSKTRSLVYYKYADLCKLETKKREFFVFTSKGLMTIEGCRKNRTGGMLAFRV